jgi:maltooligosyltrehalose trehalohydrolase
MPSAPTMNALGACLSDQGTQFRAWAPAAQTVDVILKDSPIHAFPLKKDPEGYFYGTISTALPGALYQYRLDHHESYPDPASRFQPQGVHGPSQIIDCRTFAWSDAAWKGVALKDLIIYELHVGTFTPEGTFLQAIERLPYLKDLGVTAIELMPIADFPGQRNWGYDGVSLFAPAHQYGTPQDLQLLVDKAHENGLAVILDVVYNHLGPDGNYLGIYSPNYFTSRHKTPWGPAVNLDGEQASHVRRFFIENAMHWICEYHFDGLRLDATHALMDDSRRHFLAELSDRVRAAVRNREILLMAEDCRNLARLVKSEKESGWGLDAVWSDDFHHEVRRSLAGDQEGYFRDFSGAVPDLCATIERGWFFNGQYSEHFGARHGTDPSGIAMERFIFFIQNHDQIGNRAFGERLNHQIDAASYRAAAVLLLSLPETPLLFMGQEWGASSPFLYFTDHSGALGAAVTKGRQAEFKSFSAFTDPDALRRIPDPQDKATFDKSHLKWLELRSQPHASLHRLYRAILWWRRDELLNIRRAEFTAKVIDDKAFRLLYGASGKAHYQVIIQWHGAGHHDIPSSNAERWQTILSTEDRRYCEEAAPIGMDASESLVKVRFERPGAIILGNTPS